MTTYIVRMEHGRRRNHSDIHPTPEGPMSQPYLQHPVQVTHAHVEVDDFDQHGRLRHDSDMENEARNVAVLMHRDLPGVPTDMTTKAEIIGALAP